jgi:hypothetical protein
MRSREAITRLPLIITPPQLFMQHTYFAQDGRSIFRPDLDTVSKRAKDKYVN